jgi:hypothetical protein
MRGVDGAHVSFVTTMELVRRLIPTPALEFTIYIVRRHFCTCGR